MEAGKRTSKPIGNFAIIGKSGLWAKLLYKIIVDYRPEQCLELGTCLGFSTSCQSFGLKNIPSSRLVTIVRITEFSWNSQRKPKCSWGWQCDCHHRSFSRRLGWHVGRLKRSGLYLYRWPHDEKATLDYFNRIYPYSYQKMLLFYLTIYSGQKEWKRLGGKSKLMKEFWSLVIYMLLVCVLWKKRV